ncbi:MAG TPA: lipoprotein-releasing ABC transporter permease subunit [Thermodesulfobacteriota bacterium]|nr:lipoprotein-releasing ABC transporter permease subunit [Thermodesulfobacteriota bacterium]
MSYEWYLSLRFLKSKSHQTLLSIFTVISVCGVAIGVMALIIVLGVMTGFEEDLRDKILGTNSHMVIMRYDRSMDNYREVIDTVKGVKGVVSATPFIYSQVMLTSESNAFGVVLRGVDPDTSRAVTNLDASMVEGSLKNLKGENSSLSGIIIGKELSRHLGLFYHDVVNVVSPLGMITPLGLQPRAKRFQVVGIFNSGMYEYDSTLAYIALKEAQNFLNMGDIVTGVEIRTDDIFQVKDISRRIQGKLGFAYQTKDWMEMNRNLFSALKLEKLAMFVILILIILVAAFSIIGTLIMLVTEKRKDIAILKSMGATSSSIMRTFVIVGLIIGLFGTILGVLGGYTIGWLQNTFQVVKLPGDVYYISVLPVKMNITDFFLVAVSSLIISLLATLYPSWQASRLQPVEALRYE